MPNAAIAGLKIIGNRSHGVMNPPQSPDLSTVEALWDRLDRERNKTAKEELWCIRQEARELFLRTT